MFSKDLIYVSCVVDNTIANGHNSHGDEAMNASELNAKSRRAAITIFTALLFLPLVVHAVPITYDLEFNTTGQSIWDTGSSYTLDQSKFIGAAWQDKSAGIDLLVGNENTNVINPLRFGYDTAFASCRGLGFSASACINGQSARALVPALGSRPSVRSCGRFAVGCHIARTADLARRATYDTAFAVCRTSFSSSVCRNGQSAQLPVVALGTAPPQYLNVDTRTGVAVEGTSDGRVGLELGISIDSGSVDATVSYAATLDLPDTTFLDKTNPINFNPNSLLAGTNSLQTSFSSIELSVDAIMELSGSVSAEACVIPTGCTTGGTSFNINERASVLSFNEDGEGGILFVGQTPSDLGIPNVDGFPLELDIGGLATTTLYLPQPNAIGGLNTSSQKLEASGQDDLVDLILDLDNIVATSAGVPGLFGSSMSIGALGDVGFDIINVEMGPTMDLKQDFELDPTLFVELVFDKAVMVAGEMVTVLRSAWDLLPDITFLSDITLVTPTFFLEADLLNETFLDFDLEFGIDLLQVYYDFGLLGEGLFGIGNVLDESVDLFTSPALFSKLFPLAGFNIQVGDGFEVNFLQPNTSTAPISLAARSADNPILLVANPVPTPTTISLLLLGLLGVMAIRRSHNRNLSVVGLNHNQTRLYC